MKNRILGFLILFTITNGIAQNVGLSFSYFLPRNGYFSTPVSPFSLRGIGFNFNKYIGVQTGATVYRMSGLNIIDLPFDSKDPLVGPNFTLFVPAELVFQLTGRSIKFDIKGGGFFFYGFAQKLNYGNFDRAIRKYQNWDVANSNLTYKNNPGFGYHFGGEVILYVTNQFGISLEANYLMGTASIPISGSYTGGTMAGPLQTQSVDYKNGKVDFTGFEISLGVIMTGNNGPKKPTRRRR
ncbi:MAG: hypothetical protein JST48_09555 [Bacteroidetes bacterium]|nr:hypothetical protein [Bacteroidota bacterium]